MVDSRISRKSYTARDLNRNPARVFEDVRKYGSVEINSRSGDTFVVSLKTDVVDSSPESAHAQLAGLTEHYENLQKLGNEAASAADMERFNEIIAGEK